MSERPAAPAPAPTQAADLLTGLAVRAASNDHMFVVQASPNKGSSTGGGAGGGAGGLASPKHQPAAPSGGDPFADLLTADGKPLVGQPESEDEIRRRARSSSNSRTCDVSGCANPRVSRGLCSKHAAAQSGTGSGSGSALLPSPADGGLGGLVDSMKVMEFSTPKKPPAGGGGGGGGGGISFVTNPNRNVSFLSSPAIPSQPQLNQYPASPDSQLNTSTHTVWASPHPNLNTSALNASTTSEHAGSGAAAASDSGAFDFMNSSNGAGGAGGASDLLAGLTINSTVHSAEDMSSAGSAFSFVG